jgi:hypothetical protein
LKTEERMPAPATTIRWPSLITIVSAAILIGTELLGAAWASGWAIAGLFQLGPEVEIGLQILFGLLALFVIGLFLRQAIRVEPVVGRG